MTLALDTIFTLQVDAGFVDGEEDDVRVHLLALFFVVVLCCNLHASPKLEKEDPRTESTKACCRSYSRTVVIKKI